MTFPAALAGPKPCGPSDAGTKAKMLAFSILDFFIGSPLGDFCRTAMRRRPPHLQNNRLFFHGQSL
jgi:hypothetical protein